MAYMSYSGRHLGFHTLIMIRKNDTLIFLKTCHLSKSSELLLLPKIIHEITNEPTLVFEIQRNIKR